MVAMVFLAWSTRRRIEIVVIRRAPLSLVLPILIAGLIVAGCGGCQTGTIHSDRNRSQLRTGRSLIEQTRLWVEFTRQGRSTIIYAREQCEDLRKQARQWTEETKKISSERNLFEATERVDKLQQILATLPAEIGNSQELAHRERELATLASEWPE